jgi:hypothetical protein
MFFSVVPPHLRRQDQGICKQYPVPKHNISTKTGSTAYYILDSSFHASALSNENMNSRFSICKKTHPKATVHTGQLAKFIIKKCTSPLRRNQTPANIK